LTDKLQLNIFDTLASRFEDDEDTRLAAAIDALQVQAGGTVGYRLRRIILCNYWLYGLQEFEVAHGRLFLAGENASGKSSVLAAALPLALDGDFRPNRLDTFGGRERKMEYYVLGGESSTAYSHERRTTYIALEFEWLNPQEPPFAPDLRQMWLEGESQERERARWLTIGLSLAGNKNLSPALRALRFVVTDGTRFGHELHLVDSKAVALDHPGFKRMLGEHGQVCETVTEYQERVARYLFGIEEVREFQNIMSMLVVLRRPNLGSELNLTNVHTYLKQSLRKIPEDTTRRVTGTIERIDNIQSQLERLQDAQESTSRLDTASQKLAFANARRSALVFWRARQSEISALGQVTLLNKNLKGAEAELEAARARYEELTIEEQQVEGQIAALESSEGLQIAERLAQVRDTAQKARTQLELQKEQLARARTTLTQARARQERLRSSWQQQHREVLGTVERLQRLAAEQAGWLLAQSQLQEVGRQLESFNLDNPTRPIIPPGIASLAGISSEERLARLRQLEELHQQREQAATQEKNARERETEKLSDYDAARQSRDTAQAAVVTEREYLAARLRQLYRESEWVAELPEYRLAEVVRTVLHESFSQYQEVAQNFAHELERSATRLRDEQGRLFQTKGVQQGQLNELEKLYQQKQNEPDLTPARSARRQQARERLTQAGITAYPLYALIDFSPTIEQQQAGAIERMLEDSGLLDALVIRPEQQQAAANLLQSEGLSDCWLQPDNFQSQSGPTLTDWLVFDAQAVEQIGWQSTIEKLLGAVSRGNLSSLANLAENGEWRQGLLAGQAGTGAAIGFIGTANRRRLRRQELDTLQSRLEQASQDLGRLEQQLEQNQSQQKQLVTEQTSLTELVRAEGVFRAEAERERLEIARNLAEKVLIEYQTRAREARQQLTSLSSRLLQESADIPGADSDLRRLRSLLEATRELKTECTLLGQRLQSQTDLWLQYHENQADLENALKNEQLATQLYTETQARYTQVEAERLELEGIMAQAGVQDSLERLTQLRQRRKELPPARTDAYGEQARAEERVRNFAENLAQAEQFWQQNQQQRAAAQTALNLRLAAYPVPRLTDIRLLAEREDFTKVAQRLLGNQPLPDEEQLEADCSRAFNQLNIEFHQERSTLAEYGPEMEAEGRITFVVEERVEPPALLEMLAYQIDIQKTLLGNEERALFEDFLLQEMAEAIRYHIGQTEEWVQKINRLLNNLPMVGEHYTLDWKPAEEATFVNGLGSQIARQQRLLRKAARSLTEEEKQLLMDAFRREIENLRLRQKEEPGLNFMEALIQVFDYREWFHFSIFVTPQGGTRQRLTDRSLSSRSGAEQLFALYVPLFAALAALYDSVAAPGCPRLLALDEAFDKASAANTQKIMEFLVMQGFQWIMTGPQISGMGAGVPVSTEYQMMHEKGSLVATAVPFFWVAGQELTE